MNKKLLYNIYLFITLCLGILITSFLIFYIPAHCNIETEMQYAFLIILFIIDILLFAIIASNIDNKINKC